MRTAGGGIAGAALLFLALLLSSPLASQPPASGPGAPLPGSLFEGRAGRYGRDRAGLPTASGEAYDPAGLTAAHRSLPFGTLLRVANPATGASIVVRINDRGPLLRDLILDLSEAAADLLGLLPGGSAVVKCRVLAPEEAAAFGSPPPAAEAGSRMGEGGSTSAMVLVAGYRDRAMAAATLERLRLSGITARIEEAGSSHRVLIGPVPASAVERLLSRLGSLGYHGLLVSWLPY